MNKIFLIGDTHFGHTKIAQVRGFDSLEHHNDTLIANWNATVRSKDTVWLLGDACFGIGSFDCLGKLNGTKKLVMGNHDRYPIMRYAEHFTGIYGAAELRNCVLTHIPVHQSQFHRYRANIHGHLHHNKIDDTRYKCVSAEHIRLTPVALDDVVAGLPA